LSERNTPALFGAELIDRIPADVIHAAAKHQESQHNGITGRVNRVVRFDERGSTTVDDIGRFGWRAQTATLRDFVLGASANELGLGSTLHREAGDPVATPRIVISSRKGVDLNDQQGAEMIEFVRSLPAPRQVVSEEKGAAALVWNGEELFRTVGCADCHLPKLGEVNGLYSDLLLHDLGEPLQDPSPAGSQLNPAAYYGEMDFNRPIDPLALHEWRTPPLWGVADSAPYLHDGRAATLDQAIMWHGGEAETSKQHYRTLSPKGRAKLVAFLQSLRAPSPANVNEATARNAIAPSEAPKPRMDVRPINGQMRPRPLSFAPSGGGLRSS
jgi:CxxC motif-containing protein (DUF1111 family)